MAAHHQEKHGRVVGSAGEGNEVQGEREAGWRVEEESMEIHDPTELRRKMTVNVYAAECYEERIRLEEAQEEWKWSPNNMLQEPKGQPDFFVLLFFGVF